MSKTSAVSSEKDATESPKTDCLRTYGPQLRAPAQAILGLGTHGGLCVLSVLTAETSDLSGNALLSAGAKGKFMIFGANYILLINNIIDFMREFIDRNPNRFVYIDISAIRIPGRKSVLKSKSVNFPCLTSAPVSTLGILRMYTRMHHAHGTLDTDRMQ